MQGALGEEGSCPGLMTLVNYCYALVLAKPQVVLPMSLQKHPLSGKVPTHVDPKCRVEGSSSRLLLDSYVSHELPLFFIPLLSAS